jgi:hypothetical protein
MGGMGGVDPSNMDPEDIKDAAQNMGGSAGQGDEDVVDAEYEEVDTDEDDKEE